jgi:hypothetical protein
MSNRRKMPARMVVKLDQEEALQKEIMAWRGNAVPTMHSREGDPHRAEVYRRQRERRSSAGGSVSPATQGRWRRGRTRRTGVVIGGQTWTHATVGHDFGGAKPSDASVTGGLGHGHGVAQRWNATKVAQRGPTRPPVSYLWRRSRTCHRQRVVGHRDHVSKPSRRGG